LKECLRLQGKGGNEGRSQEREEKGGPRRHGGEHLPFARWEEEGVRGKEESREGMSALIWELKESMDGGWRSISFLGVCERKGRGSQTPVVPSPRSLLSLDHHPRQVSSDEIVRRLKENCSAMVGKRKEE